MIDIGAAKKVAESSEKEYPVEWIRETDDEWIFGFYTGEITIPGVLPLCISKQTGAKRWLYLPDEDNFEMLEKAQVVVSYYE